MTRNEKLKALKAISECKMSIEDLEPPKVYVFRQKIIRPGVYQYGVYEHNGREYNEQEYRVFCEKIESKNNKSKHWRDGKDYPKEDIIIKVCYGRDNSNSSGRKVTLDLSK